MMDKYSERYASDLRELNWRRAGYRFIGSTPTHDIVFSLLSHSTLIYPRVDGVDALVVSGRHRAPSGVMSKVTARQEKGLDCICHSTGYAHHDPIVHGLPVGQ